MTRALDRFRARVDNDRLAIAVAFVGLAALTVFSIVINRKTNQAQLKAARVEAVRRAETEAAYQTCVAAIPELRRLSRHIRGVNDLARVLVQNSEAAIAAAPPGDPLAKARQANLRRLKSAQSEIESVVALPSQTIAQCAARRDALGRS